MHFDFNILYFTSSFPSPSFHMCGPFLYLCFLFPMMKIYKKLRDFLSFLQKCFFQTLTTDKHFSKFVWSVEILNKKV